MPHPDDNWGSKAFCSSGLPTLVSGIVTKDLGYICTSPCQWWTWQGPLTSELIRTLKGLRRTELWNEHYLPLTTHWLPMPHAALPPHRRISKTVSSLTDPGTTPQPCSTSDAVLSLSVLVVFPNLNVPVGYLGMVLRCTFWLGRSGAEPEALHLHSFHGVADIPGLMALLWGSRAEDMCSWLTLFPCPILSHVGEWKVSKWPSICVKVGASCIIASKLLSNYREFSVSATAQNSYLKYRDFFR